MTKKRFEDMTDEERATELERLQGLTGRQFSVEAGVMVKNGLLDAFKRAIIYAVLGIGGLLVLIFLILYLISL